jgi:hypothetical protein
MEVAEGGGRRREREGVKREGRVIRREEGEGEDGRGSGGRREEGEVNREGR